ncbi:uncharacterized mitochondrial protein-like protein isoform X2 [Tanacetum coccineum]
MGQPFPVLTTSIPTPPPPTPPPLTPPITRQRPANLHQNPKQRVPYNPSVNHATVLPITITEPTSFTVANNSPEWRQAMKEEYDALIKNGTWSLVPRASTTNAVDGKWVYRLKRDKNGAIVRYKARFVAKGCRQQPGIDFHETFSSVVKSTTIQAVLSLAVTNDWPLCQLDIQNAFLHGNLKEHVYMKQPPGFIDPQRPRIIACTVCYGMGIPIAFYLKLSQMLTGMEILIDRSGPRGGFAIYLGSKPYIPGLSVYKRTEVDIIKKTGEENQAKMTLNELGMEKTVQNRPHKVLKCQSQRFILMNQKSKREGLGSRN